MRTQFSLDSPPGFAFAAARVLEPWLQPSMGVTPHLLNTDAWARVLEHSASTAKLRTAVDEVRFSIQHESDTWPNLIGQTSSNSTTLVTLTGGLANDARELLLERVVGLEFYSEKEATALVDSIGSMNALQFLMLVHNRNLACVLPPPSAPAAMIIGQDLTGRWETFRTGSYVSVFLAQAGTVVSGWQWGRGLSEYCSDQARFSLTLDPTTTKYSGLGQLQVAGSVETIEVSLQVDGRSLLMRGG